MITELHRGARTVSFLLDRYWAGPTTKSLGVRGAINSRSVPARVWALVSGVTYYVSRWGFPDVSLMIKIKDQSSRWAITIQTHPPPTSPRRHEWPWHQLPFRIKSQLLFIWAAQTSAWIIRKTQSWSGRITPIKKAKAFVRGKDNF